MKRLMVGLGLVFVVVLTAAVVSAAPVFPSVIPLPDGFMPEGIVAGNGPEAFVGSLADGSIYRANLRTGEGELVVPPQDDRIAVGLAFDARTNYIFVAGQANGEGYVYDAGTGETVAVLTFVSDADPTFINDVVVTRSAAYFTDSNRAVLYKVGLLPNGRLPAQPTVETLPLGGDFVLAGQFNANGIDATPNGKTLIIVHSTLGTLYTVDPDTGIADEIDLNGGAVPAGDGILLDGKTLYVVQNQFNQIAEIELSADLSAGTIVELITDSDFVIPTTVTEFGNRLYAVNARFGLGGPYQIVQVNK